MIISAVPYEAVDVVWPDVEEYIGKAVSHSGPRYNLQSVYELLKKRYIALSGPRYNLQSVYELLKKRYIALWVAMDEDHKIKAAITTRIFQYPEGRGLEMDWIGGDGMEEWLPPFQDALEKYALDNGCDFMAGQGRKGWEKPLKKLGWQYDFASFRKDLKNG